MSKGKNKNNLVDKDFFVLFFISSKDRFSNLTKLLNSIYEGDNKNVGTIVIDDGSKVPYDEKKISVYPNIIFFRNSISLHKYKNFLKYFNYFPKASLFCWIDDKDYFEKGWFYFLKEKYLKVKNINDFILISDFYSKKKKIIGNSFKNYLSIENFYLTKNNIGDKLWFIPYKYLYDIKKDVDVSFQNEFIYDFELLTLPLYKHRAFLIEKLIVYHPYLIDGITKSKNLEMKKNSPNFIQYITLQKLSMNIGFFNRIYRLFELWNIRKNVSKKTKLNFFNRILYFFLFLFFPILKIYVNNKLNKI